MSGFGSSTQSDRRITELERKLRSLSAPASMAGAIASLGSFTLGGGTSTLVTDANVPASSLIFYTPNSADAWSVDGGLNGITTASGSFTVSHPDSALSRSYKYLVVNPA